MIVTSGGASSKLSAGRRREFPTRDRWNAGFAGARACQALSVNAAGTTVEGDPSGRDRAGCPRSCRLQLGDQPKVWTFLDFEAQDDRAG